MNILFDQTEAQALFYNGAAEYAQTVFFKTVSLLEEYPDVRIYSLYHSGKKFRYENLSCEKLKKYGRVIPVDYKDKSLKEIVKENNIDLLFITCAQSFCDLPLGNMQHLGCKVVSVIHDLCDEETEDSRLLLFQYLNRPQQLLRYFLSRLKIRLISGRLQSRKKQMINMLTNNDADIITVSNYTKRSLNYNYPLLRNKVHVLSSPLKEVSAGDADIKNDDLRDLINHNEKYFLILSSDRVLKNADRMIKAFKQFVEQGNLNYKLVTIVYGKKMFENHIPLPFLSMSDLEHAYKNCHVLLYPSLFEGFGYPPLEAMRYGKPVICSNVCSMPEVLENAPIYFSPIYETDMFSALNKFRNVPYSELSDRSKAQYSKVTKMQSDDLQHLAQSLLDGSFINTNKNKY